MSGDFPAEEYSSVKRAWLGTDAIVEPTIRNATDGLLQGKNVLDIGCGNGHFTKKLIEWGANSVLGVDNNEQMIIKCREAYSEEELSFECVGIDEFSKKIRRFQLATAFFTFQFIKTKELLKKAFENTFSALDEEGVLVAIVPNGVKEYNPSAEEGKKFGVEVKRGKEELRDELPLTVCFLNGNEITGSAEIHFFFRETYELLLKEVGFSRVEWSSPVIAEEALKRLGESFFHSYLTPPKDIVFKAFKK